MCPRLLKSNQKLSTTLEYFTYYDNKNYDLTRNDIWLRERNNQFELKVSKNRNVERSVDQYNEIEDEEEIKKYLKINSKNPLSIGLKKSGYSLFCKLKTIRSKYKIDFFTVDIDEVTSDGFFYGLAEIELMTDGNIEEAAEKILEFAKGKNLQTDIHTRGKVVEYIRQKRPKHFRILIEAGVVK